MIDCVKGLFKIYKYSKSIQSSVSQIFFLRKRFRRFDKTAIKIIEDLNMIFFSPNLPKSRLFNINLKHFANCGNNIASYNWSCKCYWSDVFLTFT